MRGASAGFTRITSVRELTDGTLLVTDWGERRLARVDWGTGEVTDVARRGPGPGEYRGVGWLYPMAGDTTLLTDTGDGRWHLMVGAEIVDTRREGPFGRVDLADVSGTDTTGHILLFRSANSLPHNSSDSLVVLFGDLATARTERLARVRGPAGELVRVPAGDGRPPMVFHGNPLGTGTRGFSSRTGGSRSPTSTRTESIGGPRRVDGSEGVLCLWSRSASIERSNVRRSIVGLGWNGNANRTSCPSGRRPSRRCSGKTTRHRR